MKRKEEPPIQKHCLNLYKGDYEKMQTLYATRIGAAKVIRDIIRAHIRSIEEQAAQRVRRTAIELDLEISS